MSRRRDLFLRQAVIDRIEDRRNTSKLKSHFREFLFRYIPGYINFEGDINFFY